MEEIKFRALNKELNKIYEVHSIMYEDGVITCVEYGDFVTSDLSEIILLQYTGLKDKNGVKIYEGDVVSLAGYGDYEVEFPFIELYEAYPENDILEIKGNIYENPNLLTD